VKELLLDIIRTQNIGDIFL